MTQKGSSILEDSLNDAKNAVSRILMKGYATDIHSVRTTFRDTLYRTMERRLFTENLSYTEMRKYLDKDIVTKVSSQSRYSAYLSLFRINLAVGTNEVIQKVAERQGALDC